MTLGPRRKIGSTSVENVYVPVRKRVDGGYSDITGLTVTMAFTTKPSSGYNEPTAANFDSAAWETIDGVYYAYAPIGPATDFVLTEGRYQVWVKVDDSSEDPVLFGGEVEIY